MTSDTMNISIRMDKTLKKEADELFSEMGMNISTAFNIFVRQAIRDRAFPFPITLGEKPREAVSREEGWAAFQDMRKQVQTAGVPEMTLDEINAEIAETRRERRARKAGMS